MPDTAEIIARGGPCPECGSDWVQDGPASLILDHDPTCPHLEE